MTDGGRIALITDSGGFKEGIILSCSHNAWFCMLYVLRVVLIPSARALDKGHCHGHQGGDQGKRCGCCHRGIVSLMRFTRPTLTWCGCVSWHVPLAFSHCLTGLVARHQCAIAVLQKKQSKAKEEDGEAITYR